MARTPKTEQDDDLRPHLVLTQIDHDGERYDDGDRIDLTSAQAEPLLALKAIRAPKPAKVEVPTE